jgi:ribonuclease E
MPRRWPPIRASIPVAETVVPDPAEAAAPAADDGPAKPKRKGWWSLGR